MKFEEVQNALFEKEMLVEYKSLTSDKVHEKTCIIHKKYQRNSDKILVWNVTDNQYSDIEIKTITRISSP